MCRSACKPHFHLPIFTFLDTLRALFFLLLTVLQQVVSGKLYLQNTLTKLWNGPVEFLLWRKASKIERRVNKITYIKRSSYLAYCGTVGGSCRMYNVDSHNHFLPVFDKIIPCFALARFTPLHYTRTPMRGAF